MTPRVSTLTTISSKLPVVSPLSNKTTDGDGILILQKTPDFWNYTKTGMTLILPTVECFSVSGTALRPISAQMASL